MMYSDEGEPELAKIEAPNYASNGQTIESFSPQNAVAANKKLDTGSGAGGGSPQRGLASSSPFGEMESGGTPTQSVGQGPGITGQLKALAAALGNGALGVAASLGLGGGESGARYANGKPKFDKNGNPLGPNGKPLKVGQKITIDRNLLKDRYGRYISSSKSLEFGAADTLMFESMCGHYAAYAARNRIPYDRQGCE